MDTAWLSSWLTDLSLSEYVVVFANAGYTTPEQCATIRDREALKSIGVSKLGHLNRLCRAIEKLGSGINGGGGGGEVGNSSMTLPLSSSGRDGVVIAAGGAGGGGVGRATALQQSKSATMIPSSGEGMCLWHGRKTGSRKTYTTLTTPALDYVYTNIRTCICACVCVCLYMYIHILCECACVAVRVCMCACVTVRVHM